MAEEIFGEPSEAWAFRAKAFDHGDSHVLVDATETPESVAWLMAHELSHQVVFQNPKFRAQLDARRPRDLDPASDAFHAVDPQELWCDHQATQIFGRRLDRAWWRRRTPRQETYGACGGRWCLWSS
jgi:hypothetical protein